MSDVLEKAIAAAKKAVEADNDGRWEEAYGLYINSIEFFKHTLKCRYFLSRSSMPKWVAGGP